MKKMKRPLSIIESLPNRHVWREEDRGGVLGIDSKGRRKRNKMKEAKTGKGERRRKIKLPSSLSDRHHPSTHAMALQGIDILR